MNERLMSDPRETQARRSQILLRKTPRDPESIKQCSLCRKKCCLENQQGECLVADIEGEQYNGTARIKKEEDNE